MGIEACAMESLGMNTQFWRGKHVLVTGHTGFKGGWLSLWLQKLGAIVAGYALPASQPESLFELAAVGDQMRSVLADIRDRECLQKVFREFRPDVVFHLAAQPLVRASYDEPAETFEINVMGTVNLLEAVRNSDACRVVIIVTSDKCYENREWIWGYRECDPVGGRDPYSSSKGCAELVTAAYRKSFFDGSRAALVAAASVRAGNVIGGGDFAKDRIVPDWMAALQNGSVLSIRNPDAVRPWQHVLEPLSGYLLLAEKMWVDPAVYSQAWNFGPPQEDARTVRWLVEKLNECWGEKRAWKIDGKSSQHEAQLLLLDSTKARVMLGWKPRWILEQTLEATVNWYRAHQTGQQLRQVVMFQIASYEAASERGLSFRAVSADGCGSS